MFKVRVLGLGFPVEGTAVLAGLSQQGSTSTGKTLNDSMPLNPKPSNPKA